MDFRGLCIVGMTLMSMPASAQTPINASAHCKITGATGHGVSRQSETAALDAAVKDCVRAGGIPACCRAGAHVEAR